MTRWAVLCNLWSHTDPEVRRGVRVMWYAVAYGFVADLVTYAIGPFYGV